MRFRSSERALTTWEGTAAVIQIEGLTKVYGETRAVEGATFVAPKGAVTGFLGPNGAGKTTTLRTLLGLTRPDAGTALIEGAPYADLDMPRRRVGAVLDSTGFHPGRTGRNHLRIVTRGAALPRSRVDEVLDMVDLSEAADRRVGAYSHGMRQRLALATALLGDPPVLALDEPATGLDPAGMAWLRNLMRDWAGQGRTVLFSSHVLGEVEQVADRVVIIDRSHIVWQGSASDLTHGEPGVVVSTADGFRLVELAERAGWRVKRLGRERLVIHGASPADVGRAAAQAGVVLAELSKEPSARRLEDLFLELTGGETRP
jgi:ABC-2 type transport system ATP-binding protein